MKRENGITLIALIITIIVMLILVGVTINFVINGGIIQKAKEASIQTEIAIIQEQLMLKKVEIIANNNGSTPNDFEITLASLDLSDSIKTKYASKLTISADGTLYYLEDNVTGAEKVYFENAGIAAFQETTPEPEPQAPTYPLSGKTFKCLPYASMDTFDIVFSDTTFTFYGETGTYEYDSATNKITGSITIQDTPNTINTDLYFSGNNQYFEFDVMEGKFPMSLNGSIEGLTLFSGTYSNEGNTLIFYTHESFGPVVDHYADSVFNSPGVSRYYYFEQNSTFYYDDSNHLTCTYGENYSSITLNGVTYTKQS